MRSVYTTDIINILNQLDLEKQAQKKVRQIWYTKADLCKHFGITYSTLRRWEQHKCFPLLELKNLCTGRYDIRKIERHLHKQQ